MHRMPTLLPVALAACLAATLATAAFAEDRATVRPDQYRGWKSLALSNRWVQLQVTPALGGRIAQFTAGGKAWFWVNADLAGKSPPAGGVSPTGEWLNYGGDKLWPAPQGWDHDAQWPGPPGAVLDGLPYRIETLNEPGVAAVRLTSGDDKDTKDDSPGGNDLRGDLGGGAADGGQVVVSVRPAGPAAEVAPPPLSRPLPETAPAGAVLASCPAVVTRLVQDGRAGAGLPVFVLAVAVGGDGVATSAHHEHEETGAPDYTFTAPACQRREFQAGIECPATSLPLRHRPCC